MLKNWLFYYYIYMSGLRIFLLNQNSGLQYKVHKY
jgi:hypothetical protein